MKWFWQKNKQDSKTTAQADEKLESESTAELPVVPAREQGKEPDKDQKPQLEPEAVKEPEPEQKPEPEPEPKTVEEPAGNSSKTVLVSKTDTGKTDKGNFFSRMAKGLERSSNKLGSGVSAIFTKRKLDTDTLEELEDLLISSDLGTPLARRFVEQIAKNRFDKQVDGQVVREELATLIADTLMPLQQPLDLSGKTPKVILFVGVNGSGKTTTLGKIAARLQAQGRSCLLVAGDTFRAAAIEQLQVWGQRTNARVLSRPLGSDAAGLAYDALAQARASSVDVVLMDTAGRLQNKQGLMDELAKIVRVIKKFDPDAPHHVLLVLDATVGQNALSQTENFTKMAGVTGLAMTKLDGTAKGGVLVAVSEKHQLPIHFIGIGEGIDDLQDFNAEGFAGSITGLIN